MTDILSLFSLEGRRALVTGASRGLGRAIALALAEAGADVACAGQSEENVAETASAIRRLGRAAWALGADLSDRGSVPA